MDLDRALQRAERGAPLDSGSSALLMTARGRDLDRLSSAAAKLRDRGLEAVGRRGTATYVRRIELPLATSNRGWRHDGIAAPGTGRVETPFASSDELLAIAHRGRSLGCTEAGITIRSRAQGELDAVASWLDACGYDSAIAYVRAVSIRVLEETGLLPHVDIGALTWEELQRLKPVCASVGIIVGTVATREPSAPAGHHDDVPSGVSVQLRSIEDAGRSSIPTTVGILIGTGETCADRVESLVAIRRIARQYKGVQDVAILHVGTESGSSTGGAEDESVADLLATVAVARLILGAGMRIQTPVGHRDDSVPSLLRSGVDDWGGVSPLARDHVDNGHRWSELEELERRSAEAGSVLVERLSVHPEFLQRGEPWLDPRIAKLAAALSEEPGPTHTETPPSGFVGAWASSGRTDLDRTIDTTGRIRNRRSDFDEVYGDWSAIANRMERLPVVPRLDGEVRAALQAAEADPAGIDDVTALTLFHAEGAALDALAHLADDLRRDAVGDDVTYVVNRNINFTNVCYTGCRFCAFAQRRIDPDSFTLSLEEVGRRAEAAWEAGATEICMQGGIHPDMPGTAYFDLAREVKRKAPGIHLHAFSPMEILNGSARAGLSFRDFLEAAKEAGVDSIPGTAAEILDDEVRWVLTKGKLPAQSWIEIVSTAHDVGLPSSSTMMYGHVDGPEHWLLHLRTLARIQDRTGGFTEFVALPFVHQNAPIYLAGKARAGATDQENRVVHAMARILLHGRIPNIQTSWVKLGDAGTRLMLSGGANDVGGTLMEETISRMAGADNGSLKTVTELCELAASIGRPARQRTTTYGQVGDERRSAASAFDRSVSQLLGSGA